jgi:hypothetical protein
MVLFDRLKTLQEMQEKEPRVLQLSARRNSEKGAKTKKGRRIESKLRKEYQEEVE